MNRAEKRRQQKLAKKAAKHQSRSQARPVAPQNLELAIQHHTAGRFEEARQHYQQVLQADPNQPVALHLLGLIAHQTGKHDVAVELITKAISIKPDFVEAHGNLGNAYTRLGRLDEAVTSYAKALAIRPDYADAHSNMAAAFQALGQLDKALDHNRKALAIRPDYVEAHNNLGATLRELGQLDQAVASYQRALTIKPDYANAHNGLGLTLQDRGQHAAAAHSFNQALAINPDFAEALSNLGATWQSLGKLDEAVVCLQKALSINAALAQAHNNLGITFKEQGKFEDALASYQLALNIRPDYCEAQNNLGSALQQLGKLDEAVAAYHKALSMDPDHASTHSNLGAALHAQGKLEEAVASCRKALSLKPQFADALNNLGNALKDQGQLNEAIASYQQAITFRPEYGGAYSNMGTAFQELGQLDDALASCQKAISIDPDFAGAHSNLIFIQDLCPDIEQSQQYEELKRWNEKFILPLAHKIKPHGNDRDPERRLRIGYVSADFCHHSACLGFASLILDHDSANFDIICYDASIINDDFSHTLRRAATHWRRINALSDDQLADVISADNIDILVDLSGHTRGNRLKLFGHKPAPLQVTGIGHFAPGLSTLDYRLTTQRLSPPENESQHPEQPIYLRTFFGFLAPPGAPPVGPLPWLENNTITFGYLGRISRVSDQVLGVWGRILGDLPGSRLLLKNSQLDDPAAVRNIRKKFADMGIDEDRLILLGQTDQPAHLEAHNRVDVAFDTFPHGGGMTTMDCLWMGVPVIGLLSPHRASGRIVDCICGPLGLDRWIAESPEQYHAIALDWAARREQLVVVRTHLRQQLSDVYFRFCDDVEKAYRIIWQRWCADQPPSPVAPPPINAQPPNLEHDYAAAVEHHRHGRWPQAEAAYRKVLAANPNMPSALLNLGAIVLQFEKYEQAIDLSRKVITLQPDHAGAHNNLGSALQKLGRLDEAVATFQKALALAPSDTALLNNMANVLIEQGLPDQALPYFEQALAVNPNYAQAHYNKGSALKDLGRLEDAVQCFRRSLKLNPQMAAGHYNLGRACAEIGLLDEALSSYRQAIVLQPGYQDAHSNYLMTLHYAASTSGEDLLAAATNWARPLNEAMAAGTPHFQNTADPERKLKIGYISADFSSHPVGFYLSNILPFHNDAEVEAVGYSNSRKADDTTARLRASCAMWRDVRDLSNEALGGQIIEDGIDILVDLSGHTAGHRLPVLARRPAPVQVTWMGYTGTTGLAAVDHILADHFVIPQDEQQLFSETVTYLPGCYLCFAPPEVDIATLPPPALEAGYITFGSFNNRLKITGQAIKAWSGILASVAGSRLLLKTPLLEDKGICASLLEQFSHHGIDPTRLILEGRSPRNELLRAYQRVDIGLDSQPFGGGVTTAEALWMGVPVITLRGALWPTRLGETLLNATGLAELVAGDAQHYHDLAVSLAGDLPRLERLHDELRTRVVSSALCDGPSFVNKLEGAYRQMWRNWCDKQEQR